MRRLQFKVCMAVLLALLGVTWAQANVTLNSTNFPDANFRAALSAITGVAEGGTINEATLTELDVSNKGITDITGIEKLTALTKLVANHNDIKFANITNNPHLEWLDLSNNSTLRGFNSTPGSGTTSTHWITLTSNMPLTHLDLSNCNIGYFVALVNGYHVTTLTWLSLANNPAMSGWSSGITAQTGLVYCDLTNTAQTSSTIGFTSAHDNIETLILKDNAINGPVSSLQYMPNLKYLDLSNTGQPLSSTLGLTQIHTNLETLILANNSSFGYSSSFEHLKALKYLDISHCDIYFREGVSPYYLLHYLTPTNNPNLETLLVNNSGLGSMTEGLTGFAHLKTVNIAGNTGAAHFWVNNCPMIESINITGCSGLTYLNLEQDALPRQGFTLTAGSNSNLTTVSLNQNNYGSVADAMGDLSGLTALQNLYLEENSGFNNSDYTMEAGDCGTLHGLDLGKNNFKSFTASSLPSSLTTLLLGNSPTLESVEIHNASGLTKLGTTNGLGSTTGEGLYLLGDPLLSHLDLGSICSPFSVTANNAMSQIPTLTYLDLSQTGQSQSSSLGLTSVHSSLETLILNGNSSFGWSPSLQHLSGLKYLDISNCDLFFREGASPDYYLLHYLTPSNNPNLETLLASHSKLGTQTEGLTNFKKLKTVDVSNNTTSTTVKLTQFWVNGSPELETLDISGNTALTYLKLNNDSLPRNNFTLIGGGTCTALKSLYLNDNKYSSVAQATSDFSSISSLDFLYLENNKGFKGELTLNATDCGSLKGLDLGNNGITSFNAPSLPSTLTALMIGDNPAMTRLEMHNNPGITKMTADPTMSDGSGLYLLGNSALTYMDISGTEATPNHFKHIGNNGSFNGVPIETLKASHNKFYSFRNLTQVPGGVYEHWGWKEWNAAHTSYTLINKYSIDNDEDTEQKWRYKAYWHTEPAQPDSASLEQLPNLQYLDLSYCNLKDSVYLHKNTELRYLDVSHNRNIYRSFDSSSSNPKYQKGAEFRQHLTQSSAHNFADYKKYMWLAQNTDIREYYTNDCNDTTGLYILDLLDNNKLEYLDISYTGIEQTAATHCHVSNARYIWIQDLPNLKYFYADFNGMRSMGIGTQNGKKREGPTTPTAGLKSLERLSVIGMRGTDKTTMQGSINFRENTVCTQLHYINLRHSRFDSIGVYIPTVDTLILKGNPIHYLNVQKIDNITYLDASECAFKMRGYDIETGNIFFPDASVYKNGARINGVYYDNSTNIPAANPQYSGDLTTPFSGLRAIRAYERNNLTTVLLDKSNALTEVFCFKDRVLPKISGFDNLAYNQPYDAQYGFPTQDADSLTLVWVNDNDIFNELNLTKNVNLKYLHAYNDKALGTALSTNGMDLTANTNLVTAWVSNSNLEKFTNCAAQQSTQAHLDTLKIWQNPILEELNVTKYNNLRYLDLRNCMVRNLDMSNNPQLTYFDCSNRDSTWVGQDPTYNRFNLDYDMPRCVPTIVDDPGKNSIADLQFSSNNLRVVHADNNDLYTLRGLSNNPNLETLTYSFNHINAIDLSGCPNISDYNCFHNVRGRILSELSVWSTTENNVTTEHQMYYLQLKPNAGDALDPEHHDTYLGHKWGEDSLLSDQDEGFVRRFVDDDFDPAKVIRFTKNAAGPYHGTRGENAANAPHRVTEIIDPSVELDPSMIYGEVAVIQIFNNNRNYVEYLYDDGRPNSGNRDGGGSAFGIAWAPPGEPTWVKETTADGLSQTTIVSERYFDATGAEHSEPFDGVNIIVRQMSDGSTQTVKIVR